MGLPDMSGLSDSNNPDYLKDGDLDAIAQELEGEEVHIQYIKGFIHSRDEVQGDQVEQLKNNFRKITRIQYSVAEQEEVHQEGGSLVRQKSTSNLRPSQ